MFPYRVKQAESEYDIQNNDLLYNIDPKMPKYFQQNRNCRKVWETSNISNLYFIFYISSIIHICIFCNCWTLGILGFYIFCIFIYFIYCAVVRTRRTFCSNTLDVLLERLEQVSVMKSSQYAEASAVRRHELQRLRHGIHVLGVRTTCSLFDQRKKDR